MWGLGKIFLYEQLPLSLLPSCSVTDIFSTPWHLYLIRSLRYFYFLKGDYQGGMFVLFLILFIFLKINLFEIET